MKKYIFLLVICAALVSSCGNPKAKLIEEISKLEMAEHQSAETKSKFNALQEQFIQKYPDDTLTKIYLENVSYYFLNVDSNQKAITYATQYLNAYPAEKNRSEFELIIARALYKQGKTADAINAFELVQNKTMLAVSDMRYLAALHKTLIDDTIHKASDLHWFKYAALVEHTEGVTASIDAFEKFYLTFPSSSYAASAMMLRADKLENSGDVIGAKTMFQKIIQTYPDSDQAHTAKTMLEKGLVGLTAEQQLEKILRDKAKNAN